MTPIVETLIDAITAQAGQRDSYQFFERDETKYTYPAERFEQQTGLTGISKDYALPEGQDYFSMFMPILLSDVRLRQLHDYAACIDSFDIIDNASIAAVSEEVRAERIAHQAEFERAEAAGEFDAREEELMLRLYDIEDKEESIVMLTELVGQIGAFSRQDFEAVCQHCVREDEILLKGCYAELEALNSELAVLTPQIESRSQMYNVLMGVLSKFNIADVKCYAIDGVEGAVANQDPAFAAREAEIEARSGVETNWIPAPSTQMRILQQLRQRESSLGVA